MEAKQVKDIMEAYASIYEHTEEVEQLDEVSYSAKAARAGKDIGKPGKQFAKIAKEAGERYGSKERGEKVAGAVLAKLRKEEVEAVDEGIDFKGAAREQERRDKIQKEKDKKNPSGKDRRLALGKFRPGASQEERASGGRDSMREKGTIPKKGGKDMFEHILEHLVAEGYADTNEAAIAIMANMSEEWREDILAEGEKTFPHKKVDRQVYDAMQSGETAGDAGDVAKEKRDYSRAERMRSVAAKHGGKRRG